MRRSFANLLTSILLMAVVLPTVSSIALTQPAQVYYPGSSFIIKTYCENTGTTVLHGVVIESVDPSDPWLVDHKQSLGDLDPGGISYAYLGGIVPSYASPGPHSIQLQCVDSSGNVDSFFSVTVNVVAQPTTTTATSASTTSPILPPPPPPPETLTSITSPFGGGRMIPLCESFFDSRCQGLGFGNYYVCNPSVEGSWEDSVCIDYYRQAGYIHNPFGGYCIIATATYGSPMAPEVVYMRTVRDRMIGSTPMGRVLRDSFNLWYYSWSPPVAEWISGSESLRALFRVLLIPIVLIVHGTAFVFSALGGGEVGAVVAFFVAAFLSIGTYVLLPVVLLIRTLSFLYKRVSTKRPSNARHEARPRAEAR